MPVNNVVGARTDINEMLSKLREVSNKNSVFGELKGIQPNHGITTNNFAATLSAAKDVFSQVSNLQLQSEKVKNSYVSGDKSISMSQVVLASQKSKLAFEGLVTVRNKILDAYKEIMNMPI